MGTGNTDKIYLKIKTKQIYEKKIRFLCKNDRYDTFKKNHVFSSCCNAIFTTG